jgi:hypothetical protein
MSKPIAIVAGYSVRYTLGGHLLAQLHFLAGLQQLGYDVIFAEHYGWENSCYDPVANAMTNNPTFGLGEARRNFDRIGLKRWCYVDAAGRWHGLSREEFIGLCRQSTLLLNLASPTWMEEFRECPVRIYLDSDPGFTQFRMATEARVSHPGYASPHDYNFHFSFGERIGRPDCPIPTHGLNWRPTRQPVTLELVQPRFTPEAGRFTTVLSWTAYGATVYEGQVYGQKDVEILKLLDLPQRTGPIFGIALAGPGAPAAKLRQAGWMVTEALQATWNVEAYLDYVGQSRGEFSVAKEGYVKTRCGWFSERTATYLASGKPVIVQDTGFSELIPCGEGVFAFKTADDIIAAIAIIQKDYTRHCRAARRVAEEHFAARKVLGDMLRQCDLPVV